MKLNTPADHTLLARLKASLLGVVGSFVLFASYLAIPPFGIFSGILAPFPAAYIRLIHGRVSSLIALLGAAAAISALFGFLAGILFLVMCGMIGFLMPELLLRGFSGSRALFWTTAANLLVFCVGFFVYCSVSDSSVQQLISSEISGSLNQAISIYEKSGVKGEDLELVRQSMATAADLLQRLYPALVTAMLVVVAGFNLALLKKSAAKMNVSVCIDDFSSFRNPDHLVWALILAGFSLLLPTSLATTPALNILLIVALLYFIQGMAVISALFARHPVPVLVRILLYAMLFIQPYLLAVVACIGLFDLWIDFRTPHNTQENL